MYLRTKIHINITMLVTAIMLLFLAIVVFFILIKVWQVKYTNKALSQRKEREE